MLYAEIAVDTYQDPTKKLFTYGVPEKLVKKLKPGDLVLVPFGRRTVEGFVWHLTKRRPKIKIKPIKELKTKGILTPNQIKLAQWLSTYYAAPPLDCLKCQIPGKGERHAEGKKSEIKTLLLVPYATQVRLRALELSPNERKTTLVGSRSAVFASFPNLKKIIIEEPENWVYKDERSPYYHAKDVAQKRAELEGLKLELRHLVPRVEDLWETGEGGEKGELREIGGKRTGKSTSLNSLASLTSLDSLKIIDLKRERDAGNFTPLSSEAAEAFKRPNPASLTPGVDKETPGVSPAEFLGGIGLAYVHSREVKEGVEEAIRAAGLDVNRIEIAGAEIFTQVGKAFETAVLIDTDTLFNLPDFRAHEKLLLTIAKLSRLTRSVLVQTANPDHPLFEELKTGYLKRFYQRELAAREPLLYPPFGVLAKLEFSAKTTAKVNFEAEKLYQELTANSKQLTAIMISPPYPPYRRSRGKAQLNIAIKAKNRKDLKKALDLVPPTWKAIVDPESLI